MSKSDQEEKEILEAFERGELRRKCFIARPDPSTHIVYAVAHDSRVKATVS